MDRVGLRRKVVKRVIIDSSSEDEESKKSKKEVNDLINKYKGDKGTETLNDRKATASIKKVKRVDSDFELSEEEKTKSPPKRKAKTAVRKAPNKKVKKEGTAEALKPTASIKTLNIKQEISDFELSDEDETKSPTKRKAKTTQKKAPNKKLKKEPAEELNSTKSTNFENKPFFTNETNQNSPLWNDFELLQDHHTIDKRVAQSLIKLFDEKNTVPFIARYRRTDTNNMSAEDLRHVKETYEKIVALKAKTQVVLNTIEKKGQLDHGLKMSILSARNLEQLEHLYSPFKTGSVRLVDRAKALGLEECAMCIMHNTKEVFLQSLVNSQVEGLETLEQVEKGIQHIIAYNIANDTELLDCIHKLKQTTVFVLESKRARKRKAETDQKPKGKLKANVKKNEEIDEEKFKFYFDYKIPVKYIKPHQTLAINRGENLKILSVKIEIPIVFYNRYKGFCFQKWLQTRRNKIVEAAIEDAYTRLISALIKREIRSELKSKAEKASIEVFCGNLKQILMAAPLKNRKILGVDPGFHHGCKLGLVAENGSVLDTNVAYPHNPKLRSESETIIENLLKKHNCTLIALGNGTACRETESWISDMISNNRFKPLDVTYTIVNENGASIYSCSAEAKKEFPKMDPNLISAVSLARRIQEPLAELVKIEPKHLGIGMYQHDVSEKHLEQSLNEIVSECVSFVGVDINTTSQCLLRRISGLSDKKATEIIKYRDEKGPFKSREELKKVKSIGEHTYTQCAGFLKVSYNSQHAKANKLDDTIIHPESYDIAEKVLKKLNLKPLDIGGLNLINKIKQESNTLIENSEEFATSKENLKLIIEGLSVPLDHDLRYDSNIKPLFKKGLTSIYELQVGTKLSGRVSNVTHFGCFVDVGVGTDGLLHSSQMRGIVFVIGDVIEVEVLSVDVERKRISLKFIKKNN